MNEEQFHDLQAVVEGKQPKNPETLLGRKLIKNQGGVQHPWWSYTVSTPTQYRLTQKGLKLYTRWRSHNYELGVSEMRAKFETDMANARSMGRGS